LLAALATAGAAHAQDGYFSICPWALYIPQNPNWDLERTNFINLNVNEIEGLGLVGWPASSETLTTRKVCDYTNGAIKGTFWVSPNVSPGGKAICPKIFSWYNGLPPGYQDTIKLYLNDVKNTYAGRPVIGSMLLGHEHYSGGYNLVNCTPAQWHNVLTAINYAGFYWRDSLGLPEGIKDNSIYIMPVGCFPGLQITLSDFISDVPELGTYEHNYYPYSPAIPSSYTINSNDFLTFQTRLSEVIRQADSCYKYFECSETKGNRKTKWTTIIQTCEQVDFSGPVELRWPTKEEIRCNAWLMLSRGAKGMKYFCYFSGSGDNIYSGLVDENRVPRDSAHYDPSVYPNTAEFRIFDWVKELNADLQVVGPKLGALSCCYACSLSTRYSQQSIDPDSYIDSVYALDSDYRQYNFFELGTYRNVAGDQDYFMLVNRYCRPGDTVAVKVNLNYTPVYAGMDYFIVDVLTNETVTEMLPRGTDTSFAVTLLPGGGRLFKIIPFKSNVNYFANLDHINFRYDKFTISASTTYSLDSVRIIQRHFTSGRGNWSHVNSGWMPYRTNTTEYLYPSDNGMANIFDLQYKIDGGKITTPVTSRPLYYNEQPPVSGALSINSGYEYTNSLDVIVKVSGWDSFPGLWQMRFDENPFGISTGYANLAGNGTFGAITGWDTLRATVQDGYVRLWGREAADTTVLTAWIKKAVPEATVDSFRGKLLRIGNDINSQTVTKAKRYVEVFFRDGQQPTSKKFAEKNISTAAGGYWRSQTDTFTLNLGGRPDSCMKICYELYGGINTPHPDSNQWDCTVSLDNIRLEPVSLEGDPEYHTIYDGWDNIDTVNGKGYTISEGDGKKKIYLQLKDTTGNISPEPGWYDEITLDQTKPSAEITTPLYGSTISGSVGIYGYSNDANYERWRLEYKPAGQQDWLLMANGTSPILPEPPRKPSNIYTWNTTGVQDGDYLVRLYAFDLAINQKADTHLVHVDNNDMEEERIIPDLVTFDCLPVDVATDAQGNLYITDTQDNKIWKYSPQGDSLLCFGYRSHGPDTTGFSQPVGIAVDGAGNIWVADCYNARVKKFSPEGTMLLSFGEHGSRPGEFNQPTGLALDGENIYVTDKLNDRVQKFDLSGAYLGQFGSGVLFQPSGLAIGNDIVDTSQVKFLYVSDTKNNRVVKFTLDGTLADSLAYNIGLNKAWDICLDDAGNLFIADVFNNRIVALDPYGSPYLSFGSQGTGPGQFNKPQGLAASPDGCYIYVVDTHNNRVQRFEVRSFPYGGGSMSAGRVQQPSRVPSVYSLGAAYPNPLLTGSTIEFALPRPGTVKLCVYNIAGQLVKALADGGFDAGYHAVKWDGRDDRGNRAANGVYLVRMVSGDYGATRKLVVLR